MPAWAHGYRRPWLRADVVAGLTVWGLVVPEAIAYAGIAGLPPEAGLYTLLAGLIAYGLLGGSRQLVTGATSASAALIASSVAALGPADAKEYVALASALVLTVGGLFLLAAVARLGFVTQFLSRPVTEGFIVGLAIFVGVGQLPKVLGIEGASGNAVEKLWHVVTHLDDVDRLTLGVGIVALVALFSVPLVWPRLPSGLIVIGVAIAFSSGLDLEAQGLHVVGHLPAGLPTPGLPHVGIGAMWTLVPAAAGIVLLAFSEGLAIAEDLARTHGQEIDADDELRAYGVANVASGLLGGMVAAGGMSASAVNDGAGARTQASVLVGAGATLVTVVALTPVFASLPEAVLGALILHAISHKLRLRPLVAVGQIHRAELVLAVVALVGVVVVDVLQGLVIAMVASLILHLYRSTQPHVAVLGRVGATDRFGDVEAHADAVTTPGVLVMRLDAPLYYANAASVRNRVRELVHEAVPPLRAVVFDPEVQVELDVTSLEMIEQLIEWLHERGIVLFVVRPHARALELLGRSRALELLGAGQIVDSTADGVDRAVALPPPSARGR